MRCIQNNIPHKVFRTFDDEQAIFEYVKQHITDACFPYDGIFCNTDVLACQVIDILSENDIRVPDDVQIIGYDGIRQFGSGQFYCSTIRQPLYEMAETAINLLLNPDRRTAPALVCLPVSYCYGGTTKA